MRKRGKKNETLLIVKLLIWTMRTYSSNKAAFQKENIKIKMSRNISPFRKPMCS